MGQRVKCVLFKHRPSYTFFRIEVLNLSSALGALKSPFQDLCDAVDQSKKLHLKILFVTLSSSERSEYLVMKPESSGCQSTLNSLLNSGKSVDRTF